ncbi:hypothetical protein [Acetobacterium sp.]|uniref:hypothetical protein n=1 Tax=Acetobacterium sp. TaxID=1872094 RepID=UPI0035938F0B
MYLSQLDLEEQELFLDLAIYAALANNEFADKEKEVVAAYCLEMGFENSSYEPKLALDEVLDRISKKCTKVELNMIIVEILALVRSDDTYDPLEAEFVEKIQHAFDISDEKIEKIQAAINQLMGAYETLNAVIQE